MVTKTKFILFTFSILSYTIAQAQSDGLSNIADHLLMRQAGNKLNSNASFEGSPYLTDDFTEATVFFARGPETVIPIRYNIYDDWIEYQENNQTYILNPTVLIKKIHLENEILIVDKYLHKGKRKHGYFTLLDSGQIILLSKRIVVYDERPSTKVFEGRSALPTYSRTSNQYYYKIDGELKKVDNLKNIISNLPAHREEIAKFAKEEKISVRKEEELVKLFRFYNSLDCN